MNSSDKFLNYEDFLPADVLDVAFKNWNDPKATALADMTSSVVDVGCSERGNVAVIDEATEGGNKKGKKGKKVSPSVLGLALLAARFDIVCSRIMMEELQTNDDEVVPRKL